MPITGATNTWDNGQPMYSDKLKPVQQIKPVSKYLHLLTLPISSYVTEGLAKIFDFEVLRHGTSIPNYLSIIENGADPAYGGTGSTVILYNVDSDGISLEAETCKGRFHVFKDSECVLAPHDNGKRGAYTSYRFPVVGHIIKRTHTHFHAVLSGISYAKNIDNKIVKIVASIFLGIANFFSPKLRFIYRKSEIGTLENPGIFEDDPDYNNMAYRTNQKLPNDRIGLIGICKQATLADAKRAWKVNPLNVLTGVGQVIVGIGLTIRGLGILF